MDPNATLEELRDALRAYLLADSEDTDKVISEADRVYSAAQALDGWLSNGGFLPRDWQAGRPAAWDSDPDFPRADWAAEVANGDTSLGYPQWVAQQRAFDAAGPLGDDYERI